MNRRIYEELIHSMLELAIYSYYEGYYDAEEDYHSPYNSKDLNASWLMSSAKISCDNLIAKTFKNYDM